MIVHDSFRGSYDLLPIDKNSNVNDVPFIANDNLYGYGCNLIAINDKYYLPLDEWQQNYKNDRGSSKMFFKYVVFNNGNLSPLLVKLLKEISIVELTPNLFLLC